MSRNGVPSEPAPRIRALSPQPSAEEAAAIAAAVERFVRDTASGDPSAPATPSAWLRRAMLEAVGAWPAESPPGGDGEPWLRSGSAGA